MKTALPRLFILIVLFINLQCALQFILRPETYAPGFELPGLPGQAAVRAFGVLFLMWNVPYIVAAWNPFQHRTALYESIAMQTIGLIGEILLYHSLPAAHAVTRASMVRFILFDAGGLAALLTAAALSARLLNRHEQDYKA